MSIQTPQISVDESPEYKNLKALVDKALRLVKPDHFDISEPPQQSKGGWARVESAFGRYKADPRLEASNIRVNGTATRRVDAEYELKELARLVSKFLQTPEVATVFPPEVISAVTGYKTALLDEFRQKKDEAESVGGYAEMDPRFGGLMYESQKYQQRSYVSCLGNLMHWVENNQEALRQFVENGTMPTPEEMRQIQIEKRKTLVTELVATLSKDYPCYLDEEGLLNFAGTDEGRLNYCRDFRGEQMPGENLLKFLEQAIDSLLQHDETAIPAAVIARYRGLQAGITTENPQGVNPFNRGKGYYEVRDTHPRFITSFGPIFEHFVPPTESVATKLAPPQTREIISIIRRVIGF